MIGDINIDLDLVSLLFRPFKSIFSMKSPVVSGLIYWRQLVTPSAIFNKLRDAHALVLYTLGLDAFLGWVSVNLSEEKARQGDQCSCPASVLR